MPRRKTLSDAAIAKLEPRPGVKAYNMPDPGIARALRPRLGERREELCGRRSSSERETGLA